jgi:hypothetical protein
MKRKATKTFVAKVELIAHKTPDMRPDLGLGKGVLYEAEVKFMDDAGRGFDNPMFYMSRMQHEEKMIREVVRVTWEEKPKRKRT